MRDFNPPFAIVPAIPGGARQLYNIGIPCRLGKDPSDDDMYIVPVHAVAVEQRLKDYARRNQLDPIAYIRADNSAYLEAPSTGMRVEIGTFREITKAQADLTSYYVRDLHTNRYYDID